MIARHVPAVLDIENAAYASHASPWSSDDFLRCLRNRNCIGMVAEQCGDVVGYMVYGMFDRSIELLNIAVSPNHRLLGIGSQMLAALEYKLVASHKRDKLTLLVREHNVVAQIFFRKHGFRATQVIRDCFQGEDGYWMESGK
jgi:ribosomal-protein-alanine N-acetyltransferase